ncbi:CoA transferase [Persicimonas caeni]|uniref:CoA transferase n=1 Tax=Persicimonas caeni TaxID=2292766 RepID=A0A4Y6Q2K9_PERCE|nr:CaiB/BaiF CoA-transferase family protein [Persicimonas caeni]QDG54417.1 CoA transferase [Persicimonas caeni]QED35638.1 CoA transferase [Persicimonas caeni]
MNADELWLSDLKVLDLSRLLPGPFCTLMLADMGADVLKIESTTGGDYARYYPPMAGEYGAFFAGINRNKRSMTLNLKEETGVYVLQKLVEEADILVESFRPGVMDRLCLGYETLSDINEGLIYCSISGYGQIGPMKGKAGHDLNYMARAGLLEQNGRHGESPVVPGFQLADIAGGALYAAVGILAALHKRERTGKGAHVDISMTDGALSFHLPMHSSLAAGQPQERGRGMLTGGLPCYNVYETKDGKYLSVGSLEPKFWMGFVQVIDAPEVAGEGMNAGEQGEETRAQVAEVLRQKTLEEWLSLFEEADVCVEPVRSPAEVLEDELFKAREMFFDIAGVHQTRTPLTPKDREHTAAPGLGEHTEEVLEGLGYGAEEVGAMKDEGVI